MFLIIFLPVSAKCPNNESYRRFICARPRLKIKYFGSKDIILHRRELLSADAPFECLADEHIRSQFNDDLLQIMRDVKYRVISVVIDKLKHVEKYGLFRAQDPYALALEYLMQRYQYWLQEYQAKHPGCMGDILAEARGGREDTQTKATYSEIYHGKGYNPLRDANKCYSSSEIKLKPKKANIAGLQFVDMISHPARRYILMSNGLGGDFKRSSFEQKIVDVLVDRKFRRDSWSRIEGAGTVFFPKAEK